MIRRPHRVNFRLTDNEKASMEMLVYVTRTNNPSSLFRLAMKVMCEVLRHRLTKEQANFVLTEYASNALLESYRLAYLAGPPRQTKRRHKPAAAAAKERKRPPQKPSARFKGIPSR